MSAHLSVAISSILSPSETRQGHLFFFVFDQFTTPKSTPLALIFPLKKSPQSDVFSCCFARLTASGMNELTASPLALKNNLFYRKEGKAGRSSWV
jgi:hypothetical protein